MCDSPRDIMKKKLPDLLVTGNSYWVPCIPIPDEFTSLYLTLEDGWLPVLSPAHIDRESVSEDRLLEQNDLHFHVDVRFLKSDIPIGGSIGVSAKIFAAFSGRYDPDVDDEDVDDEDVDDEMEDFVEWKLKKCYRLPVDDFENSIVPNIYEPGIIAQGQKLIDKQICPHQKTCLKGVPQFNGAVVCPAHGLKWDIDSGNLLLRSPRNSTVYAFVMSELYKEALDLFNPDYAKNADKHILIEIWNRLPVESFYYFDKLTFKADRDKYL